MAKLASYRLQTPTPFRPKLFEVCLSCAMQQSYGIQNQHLANYSGSCFSKFEVVQDQMPEEVDANPLSNASFRRCGSRYESRGKLLCGGKEPYSCSGTYDFGGSGFRGC